MPHPPAPFAGTDPAPVRGALWLTTALLGVWLLATFGVGYFAYDLQILIGGWPLGYWVAAQGAVLVFLALVVLYCCMMARFERRPQQGQPPSTDSHD